MDKAERRSEDRVCEMDCWAEGKCSESSVGNEPDDPILDCDVRGCHWSYAAVVPWGRVHSSTGGTRPSRAWLGGLEFELVLG